MYGVWLESKALVAICLTGLTGGVRMLQELSCWALSGIRTPMWAGSCWGPREGPRVAAAQRRGAPLPPRSLPSILLFGSLWILGSHAAGSPGIWTPLLPSTPHPGR